MEVLAFVFLVLWLIPACVIASSASERGMSPFGWFLITCVFGVIGIVLFLAVRRPLAPVQQQQQQERPRG